VNILLVNYEYPPYGGGAGNATQQIAYALVTLGHSVTVLTGGRVISETNGHNIDVIRVGSVRASKSGSNLREMWSFLVKACLWVLRQDIGYWNTAIIFFAMPCGPIGLLLKWRLGIPYVVSLRGGDVPGFEPSINWLHILLKPIRYAVYRKATAIVANSHSLSKLSRATDPFFVGVITNGVDINFFKPRVRTNSDASPLLKILMVSRFRAQKNLLRSLVMLEHARRVGIDYALTLVGDGPEHRNILGFVKSRDLNDVVALPGWIGKSELASVYQASDCFLSLSLYEGMSNTILEAMASSIPVLASDIPAHREVIEHGINGYLVSTEEIDTLVKPLSEMSNQANVRMDLGTAARRTVADRHNWTAVANQYAMLFTNDASQTRRHRSP
jgi:glycosyltransferase involved in cell wall biosynthesis